MNKTTFKHNMQPPAGILNVFSRLNYKPYYAIAEFVDNSTQSYLLHRSELRNSTEDYLLKIDVSYDADNQELIVEDNAFGMEIERFLDAITLDAKNNEQVNSRNEFGMGLKTAASWFGNVWSVSSTALGSTKRYTVIVDIPRLHNTGENDIEIVVENVAPEEHGTTVRITQLTKGMGSRTVGKTRSMLASMYRRDLKSNEVSITVNGVDIEFEDYPVLTFRDRKWKKSLDFSVPFRGKKHHVSGFVGILNPGGFAKAGFALFRRNRVIVGGEEQNYKPHEIFGQAQSQISLKLFGELDMEDFPVNQAKDGFIWDDGLEDEFIEALKDNIRDYIDIAKMSKEQRVKEEQYSSDASKRVEKEVSKAIENLNSLLIEGSDVSSDDQTEQDESQAGFLVNQDKQDIRDAFAADLSWENNQKSDFVSNTRLYEVRLDKTTIRNINVVWEISNSEKWITVCRNEENDLKVSINVNHRFFKPYSNEEEFQIVLEKFVIAFVVAEEQSKLNSDKDGFIMSNSIRNNMNRYLNKLSEG